MNILAFFRAGFRSLHGDVAGSCQVRTRRNFRLHAEALENRRILAADLFPSYMAAPATETNGGDAAQAGDCPYMAQSAAHALSLLATQVSAIRDVSPGDFNSDGSMDILDLDALTAAIATASSNMRFDLTADSVVDGADLNSWLTSSGEANLGPGRAYAIGDADLDGEVDIIDWHHMNWHMFTHTSAWSQGDFNADGIIDGSDWGLWMSNRYTIQTASRPPQQESDSKPTTNEAQPSVALRDDGTPRKFRGQLRSHRSVGLHDTAE